jgi:hypothetical protein
MSSAFAKPATTAISTDDWRPFPFRRVLPIAQLLLCAVLLWPYRAWIAFEVFSVTPRYSAPRVTESTPHLEIPLNAEGQIELPAKVRNIVRAHENAFNTVAALNLPGGIVQLPYAIYSADHREWIPGNIDFQTWRALSWPLLALPFWWMAGRGAEALASARRKLLVPRLRWPETVISFLLMAGGATLALGFFFFTDGPDRSDPLLRLFSVAGGMWAVFGSLTVAARLAQWRIRKKNLAGLASRPSPTL